MAQTAAPARTRPTAKRNTAARGGRAPARPQATVVGIPCGVGFREYVRRAAGHARVSVAHFLEHAAIAHAKATGFEETPPSRY